MKKIRRLSFWEEFYKRQANIDTDAFLKVSKKFIKNL